MSSKYRTSILPGLGALVLSTTLAGFPSSASAATVDEISAAGEARTNAAAADQQRIDAIASQIDQLVVDYTSVIKVVDGLKVYNSLLQRQVTNQEQEMVALRESIDNVALIERQIVPLMTRMLDSLEEFIALDTPFLVKERNDRLLRLRDMMERSDVTAAEKFRRVLEAYSIENDYGRTIEAYKGTVEIEGRPQEVDFLRIGRVSLTYQSVGGQHTGGWDSATRQWVELSPETYKAQVADGLKIARKQVAPDLIVIPVTAAAGVAQ
ncbi:MAG: DUF3450 family protein [Xanthomonadales bacterium]|nr:DUF3450 family protein [Xanthomonadales bacterium]NIN58612.1 DUF3450 family protein [Xanthomonadales bacterium]NIN73901.1 DUF3450 family protein [Xanthomonadales bacterium]NIP11005.1 DUF3450 family protein [Xanthomonadales bacterium]NIQ36359.1 DUF3450 family protein [Xanthomonadales bacterium]